MILSERCSISHAYGYLYIFDSKASLRVTIASLVCVSCIFLSVVFHSNKQCVISNLVCVRWVMCQSGIKQEQTLMFILEDFLVVNIIFKKRTRAANL